MLKIEIKNPAKSENMWAASVIIANELAIIPPAISAPIRIKATRLTKRSFLIIFFWISPYIGIL